MNAESKPLSPDDLLHMKSRAVFPMPGSFDCEHIYLRKHWSVVQSLVNMFQTKWKRDYVNVLQQRAKWHKCRRNLAIMTLLYYMMNTNDNSHSTLVRPVTKLVGLVETED